MNLYITFSGRAYDATTEKIVARAPQMGADKVLVYDDSWLMHTEFYKLNKWLWSYPKTDNHRRVSRGFGWFAWKPFIILDALARCADGDVVLYTDGDTFPVSDFSALYKHCRKDGGVMLFNEIGCHHEQWNKRDCDIVMGLDRLPMATPHGCARFMLFQRGPWLVPQFLAEWLTYCLNWRATTFEPSEILPEYPELKEHRCEQAILTNLAYKYNIKLYRTPDQNGATQPEDQEIYHQLFEQVGCGKSLELGSRYRNV